MYSSLQNDKNANNQVKLESNQTFSDMSYFKKNFYSSIFTHN